MQQSLAITDSLLLPPWGLVRPFTAELWLVVTILTVLLVPFFVRRRIDVLCAWISVAGLALAIGSVAASARNATAAPADLMTADACAIGWKLILFSFVAGVIALQWGRTRRSVLTEHAPEFYTLLLGSTLGMSLMASASNWLTLFLSVELTSLASYLLAGFHKTQRRGAEASLKYVLFGASITAVMAYGLSLLYGLTGTLTIVSLPPGGHTLAIIACFGLIAGLGFKISAVPFHFWCPDVFEGAQIEVTTFLSVASKGAALILLMRVLLQMSQGSSLDQPVFRATAALLGVLAAATITVGNTAAFAQTNMKRLLAYSSIAQAGYVLAALSTLNSVGLAPAVLLYLAVYAVMNLGAFAVVTAVMDTSGGDESIRAFRGMGRRSPVLAAAMVAALVSLIGLPPLAGFGAKLSILWPIVQTGPAGWGLAAVIVINTVVSAFYYFRVIRMMYLEPGEIGTGVFSPALTLMAALCAILLVAGFIAFGPLTALASRYGHLQFQTVPFLAEP